MANADTEQEQLRLLTHIPYRPMSIGIWQSFRRSPVRSSWAPGERRAGVVIRTLRTTPGA
jgi:hypothetical protein